MTINKGLFTSKTDLWSTPQDFYDKLNEKFGFTLDPCATKENAKCKKFFVKDDDGLKQSWDDEIVFVNPPYGRVMKDWIKKASEARGGLLFVYCQLEQIHDIFTNIFIKRIMWRSNL